MTQEAKSTQSAPAGTSADHATVSPPTVLVVGRGPKAVAIEAKREILARIAQGPGFPNLSCLGLLADRILASY